MSLKDQTEQKLEENLLLLGYSLVKLNIIYVCLSIIIIISIE